MDTYGAVDDPVVWQTFGCTSDLKLSNNTSIAFLAVHVVVMTPELASQVVFAVYGLVLGLAFKALLGAEKLVPKVRLKEYPPVVTPPQPNSV